MGRKCNSICETTQLDVKIFSSQWPEEPLAETHVAARSVLLRLDYKEIPCSCIFHPQIKPVLFLPAATTSYLPSKEYCVCSAWDWMTQLNQIQSSGSILYCMPPAHHSLLIKPVIFLLWDKYKQIEMNSSNCVIHCPSSYFICVQDLIC